MQSYTKASFDGTQTQREIENLAVAYRAACESIVLLKNDGALPFSDNRLALYGAGAAMTVKGGTGSGEVNERHSVTILEGLQNRGFAITSRAWLEDHRELCRAEAEASRVALRNIRNLLRPGYIIQTLFQSAQIPVGRPVTEADVAASDTDQCIYVIRRQAGEGGDRKPVPGDYCLTEDELSHIRFCAEHYAKFVLVINCGSSMDLSALDGITGINAILYICQLGTEGGHAVADILSGKATPCGKLSDTWAKQYDDIPFAHEYTGPSTDKKQAYYKEDIYVGYRYFDSFHVEPAYPFGFGLSYTTFSFSDTALSAEGSTITLSTAITNTGNRYSGKEVAELYVSAPQGKLHKEYQSLAAFQKTSTLAPQQTETVLLTFDLAQLASYRTEDACFVLEAGDYILRLGNSSRNTVPVGIVSLSEEIIVSKHVNICPLQSGMETLTAPAAPTEVLPESLPRLCIDTSAIATKTHDYSAAAPANEKAAAFTAQLTLREMVDIVVGIGMFGGEKRFHLPGSVGNTTSKFWDRGLVNVALCDGPAGLRLAKRATIDETGMIKPAEMALSIYNALPGFIKKRMLGNPEKDRLLYQYTTAFPVTNALAQTWNAPLLTEIGYAIFREMQEYGCTYWLAPAINIHRNPLCGRNFEYFSEDPFLTGKLAAAMTRGVQQEEGYYVTVKHFCCNNQEKNRTFVSSEVTERALREIYLRAFERTVREGGAKGIMTSYNLINGVYAPNSHDLCTKVLRKEWGFDGVVMTDWFSTNKGQANNALAMAAGNDLIMPGGKTFKNEILRGVKSGRISEYDVRRCCENVVHAVMNSAIQREYIG